MLAIIVMLNNFLHDLTSAIWLVAALTLWYLDKAAEETGKGQTVTLYARVFPGIFKISLFSLGLNLVFGAIRAWAYLDYEYLPAAGRGQVTALITKHILIFAVVAAGIIVQIRLFKRNRDLLGRK